MDSNFIDNACANDFTILPAISGSDAQLLHVKPPEAVDYLCHSLEAKQYCRCWKAVTNNHFMKPFDLCNLRNIRDANYFQPLDDVSLIMPSTSSIRLENACWRAWYKSLKHLKELNPDKINWYKINDVTCLYGPVISDSRVDDSNLTEKFDSKLLEEPITPVVSDSDSETESLMSYSGSTSSMSSGTASPIAKASFKDAKRILKPILKKKPPTFFSSLKKGSTKTHRKRISFSPIVQVGLIKE